MKRLILALALLFPVAAFGQHKHSVGETKPAETALAAGLGDVHHPVSTANDEAQKFFDQGLAYIYAFNHEAAARSFKRAAELDPQLAMAYWGVALSLGSNYNLQADAPQLKEAYASVQKALSLAPRASENDRAYIEALAKRYSSDPQADRQTLALAYRTAMSQLVKRYPDDLDAATLYAESMMNLRPWQLWSADGKPAEGTTEIVAVLEGVLKRDPTHTGANHYYIHAVEASPNPERALPSASRLERLAPAAGHLVHMPAHIYIRTGDYAAAAQSNADAIVADRAYFEKSGKGGVYPAMYYNHNLHFLASAHAMNGRYSDSIRTARELEEGVKPLLKAMPMLEMFAPYPIVTLVRFQKWDEILKLAEPAPELKITGAYRRFARGMAYAETREMDRAEAELKSLRDIIQTMPADAPLGNSTARGVLSVAERLLGGQIALARGDRRAALESLRKAVEAEDALSYNEPADWDLPVREWLGGALLAGGEYTEAEQVFRAELVKHPRNGRALFGLVESLKRQGNTSSARLVQREFDRAWAKADTKLSSESFYGASGAASSMKDHAAPSLRYADARLTTGVRLRYAEQGDASGQPVIMLHGVTDSSVSFTPVLPLLSAKYHVYVLDLRGHGDSDRPASGYALTDFAADVLAFMDAKGLKRATIVGHSMGSFIAQVLAMRAPERVERLVLIGSATTMRNDNMREMLRTLNALGDRVPESFAREFQDSTLYRPLPEEFMQRVVAESLKVPARVWKDTFAGFMANDYRSGLVKIKAPTLVLWGDRDAIFPRSEQDALVKVLPNAVLKVYPETGHALHWERPEQFAEDLKSFLGRDSDK
ncbi:MAG TPA: alpha/beta fold hydrolase [Pyrinomonadaceae bacterium]|nr:alpha/beta fold hydrolase [Pyrinomonadaceae bacterium]